MRQNKNLKSGSYEARQVAQLSLKNPRAARCMMTNSKILKQSRPCWLLLVT